MIDLDELADDFAAARDEYGERKFCEEGINTLRLLGADGFCGYRRALHMAILTGARFDRGWIRYSYCPRSTDDCGPCAEALLAQWWGLAPVVKDAETVVGTQRATQTARKRTTRRKHGD